MKIKILKNTLKMLAKRIVTTQRRIKLLNPHKDTLEIELLITKRDLYKEKILQTLEKL